MAAGDPDVIKLNAFGPDREMYVLKRVTLIVGSVLFRNCSNAFQPFEVIAFFLIFPLDPILREFLH